MTISFIRKYRATYMNTEMESIESSFIAERVVPIARTSKHKQKIACMLKFKLNSQLAKEYDYISHIQCLTSSKDS